MPPLLCCLAALLIAAGAAVSPPASRVYPPLPYGEPLELGTPVAPRSSGGWLGRFADFSGSNQVLGSIAAASKKGNLTQWNWPVAAPGDAVLTYSNPVHAGGVLAVAWTTSTGLLIAAIDGASRLPLWQARVDIPAIQTVQRLIVSQRSHLVALVTSEGSAGGALVCLDFVTGDVVWNTSISSRAGGAVASKPVDMTFVAPYKGYHRSRQLQGAGGAIAVLLSSGTLLQYHSRDGGRSGRPMATGFAIPNEPWFSATWDAFSPLAMAALPGVTAASALARTAAPQPGTPPASIPGHRELNPRGSIQGAAPSIGLLAPVPAAGMPPPATPVGVAARSWLTAHDASVRHRQQLQKTAAALARGPGGAPHPAVADYLPQPALVLISSAASVAVVDLFMGKVIWTASRGSINVSPAAEPFFYGDRGLVMVNDSHVGLYDADSGAVLWAVGLSSFVDTPPLTGVHAAVVPRSRSGGRGSWSSGGSRLRGPALPAGSPPQFSVLRNGNGKARPGHHGGSASGVASPSAAWAPSALPGLLGAASRDLPPSFWGRGPRAPPRLMLSLVTRGGFDGYMCNISAPDGASPSLALPWASPVPFRMTMDGSPAPLMMVTHTLTSAQWPAVSVVDPGAGGALLWSHQVKGPNAPPSAPAPNSWMIPGPLDGMAAIINSEGVVLVSSGV